MKTQIAFDERRRAPVVWVGTDASPAHTLAALNLPPYQGMIVVHGGAGGMEPALIDAVRRFVVAGLAPLSEEHRFVVVDGGTDCGTALVLGAARTEIGGTYPLIGVVPHRFVSYPGSAPLRLRLQQNISRFMTSLGGASPVDERTPLNPAHSHFIFVDGDAFGAESKVMVGLLRASGKPGVALIINGGQIVLQEAIIHARQDNDLVIVKGSGRMADKLNDPHSPERAQLPPNARLHSVDIQDPQRCVSLLTELLT